MLANILHFALEEGDIVINVLDSDRNHNHNNAALFPRGTHYVYFLRLFAIKIIEKIEKKLLVPLLR